MSSSCSFLVSLNTKQSSPMLMNYITTKITVMLGNNDDE